ncbi:hypothetical protein HY734_01115 [Candidatus Uhrbacteria bacterium]|nr:hypothetical protein [Candidatus Uhrbacteria bacterium]
MTAKTPHFDARLKTILDVLQSGERVCSVTGQPWRLTEEEIALCRKFNVPPSTIAPDVRLKMMNGFNTGLAVFWKEDAKTGKPVISAIHPDSPIQVVNDTDWFAEDWSEKGRPIDAQRPFWDQLWDLMRDVPYIASRSTGMQNTVGVGAMNVIDSYMACGSADVTRSFYTYAAFQTEDSVDVANSRQVARSYHVAGSANIVDSQFVFESQSCLSCSFVFDCWNCENCFGAVNKRNKKYLWFNGQLTKEEWERRRKDADLSSHAVVERFRAQFYDLWKREGVWPASFETGNTESDGERLTGCVRCTDCYWQLKSVDCRRCRFGFENTDCAYLSGVAWETGSYMSTGCSHSAADLFCMNNDSCQNMELSVNCHDSQDCFGCAGLRNKRFHVLNRPYDEQTYWHLVDEIKCRMLDEGTYGNFFPGKFSPSGFQYSTGELYIGYSLEDLEQYGALSFDPARGQVLAPHKGGDVQPLSIVDIPDTIDETDPAVWVGKPIVDPEAGRNFSVIPVEFEVYRAHRWPFPRAHFVRRLTDLVRHSNGPIKEERVCATCDLPIVTYRNMRFPERKVLCQACYLKHLEQYG